MRKVSSLILETKLKITQRGFIVERGRSRCRDESEHSAGTARWRGLEHHLRAPREPICGGRTSGGRNAVPKVPTKVRKMSRVTHTKT